MPPPRHALPPREQRAARRKAMSLTQRQLAELLGVSVRTVEEWEAGRARPSGDPGKRYADLLADFQRRIERAGRGAER